MSLAAKEHLRQTIEQMAAYFEKDIIAIPDERYAVSIGGVTRTPADIVYEVAVVNNRLATRLSGGDPGPPPQDGWITAPEDQQSKSAGIDSFKMSIKNLLDACDGLTEVDMDQVYHLPMGDMKPKDLLGLASVHVSYHLGQLNFIQAFYGDNEVHW